MNADELLGACCGCGKEGDTVRNVFCLSYEGPPGFGGWGCFVCYLPSRGAVAVMCDECVANKVDPVRICAGKHMSSGERLPLAGFERKPHEHDAAIHAREQRFRHINDGGLVS